MPGKSYVPTHKTTLDFEHLSSDGEHMNQCISARVVEGVRDQRRKSENADFQMFLSFCLLLLRLPALVGDAGDAAVMLHDSHWQSSCHTCETGVGLLSFSSRSSNGKDKSTCIDTLAIRHLSKCDARCCDRPSAVIQRVHSGKALLSEMCVHNA